MELFNRIIRWSAVLGTVTMVLLMFTVVVDVIARWLRFSLYGVFELNGLLVGISIFLGLAFVQAEKKHIGVNFLSTHLGDRANHIINGILMAICAVFFSWMTWIYGEKAFQAYLNSEVVEGYIQFPLLPLKIAMVLGVALLTIQFYIDAVKNWVLLFRKHRPEPNEPAYRPGLGAE